MPPGRVAEGRSQLREAFGRFQRRGLAAPARGPGRNLVDASRGRRAFELRDAQLACR